MIESVLSIKPDADNPVISVADPDTSDAKIQCNPRTESPSDQESEAEDVKVAVDDMQAG